MSVSEGRIPRVINESRAGVRTYVRTFPLAEANQALASSEAAVGVGSGMAGARSGFQTAERLVHGCVIERVLVRGELCNLSVHPATDARSPQ